MDTILTRHVGGFNMPRLDAYGTRTVFRELRALGAPEKVAKQVAGNARHWWRNSGTQSLNSVLTIEYYDRLGLPRLL